jgi:integral membrane sensor domain MASE1
VQQSTVFGKLSLQTAGQAAALAALYFIAAKLSLAFAIPPGYASPLWVPSGLALAACLLIGPRLWPGIWVGAALVNLTVDQSFIAAVLIGTGNTFEALAGVALIRRWTAAPQRLQTTGDALRFIAAAALASLVAPTIAAAPLMLDHALTARALLANWFTWWQGDLLGILIVTPLLLSWSTRSTLEWTPLRVLEAACGLGLMVLTAEWLFSAAAQVGNPQPMPYMVIPFVLWAALRFRQREVTTAVAILCGLALWHTIAGSGPLATGSSVESLSILLGFVVTLVAMGLILSAALEERREALDRLRMRHDRLEASERERSADLERANLLLQEELARRVRLEHGLQETEQRFRLMTENVIDYAIYMFDPHGRVMSWNAGRRAQQGIYREGDRRPVDRALLSARAGRERRAAARHGAGVAARARAERRLAGAQGRQHVLGRGRDDRGARPGRPAARVLQRHARPHRAQAPRGGADARENRRRAGEPREIRVSSPTCRTSCARRSTAC